MDNNKEPLANLYQKPQEGQHRTEGETGDPIKDIK
jgi:hypothetical protein